MPKKINKIAVVGAGNWGKNLVRNFSEILNPENVTVCDKDQKRLDKMENKHPGIDTEKDFEKILQDNQLPAVVVATPAATHYKLAKKILNSEKHALVEKPLALETAKGQELLEIAENKELTLMVDHLLEYHPVVEKMKNLIEKGTLGNIYYAYSQRVNLGIVRTKENALWSLGPHDISVLLYLFDEEPEEVTAKGGVYLQQEDHIEDVVFLDLEFDDNLRSHTHLSWLDPHKIRKLTLVGSEKMAVFDDMASTDKLKIFDKGARKTTDGDFNVRYGDVTVPNIDLEEPLKKMCLHFLDSIENCNQPRSNGQDGLQVLKVLEKGQQSLDNGGKPVEITG